jgi:hypothetical protein
MAQRFLASSLLQNTEFKTSGSNFTQLRSSLALLTGRCKEHIVIVQAEKEQVSKSKF